MSHPIEILEQYWGYTSFREGQQEIIDAVLNNEDVFALLPTGGGKSLCYQVPALIKEGICIVVSPLIALMNDQVNALKARDIKAMVISSEYSRSEIDTMLDNCLHANYKFLYLSPERLQSEVVQERIRQMAVNLIAVDEAHCISEWGHDFRPAYRHIKILRELHPTVNVLALTATARKKVIEDVTAQLDMIDPVVIKHSFSRPNLRFSVLQKEDKNYALLNILKQKPGSGIVYLRSRKGCVYLADFLNSNGQEAVIYHGGLSNELKKNNYERWKNSSNVIMVATNAFGMGIDKGDVRSVVHYNLPDSLESYFQEAGRAGRDKEEAEAVILTNNSDVDRLFRQFLDVIPNVDGLKVIYKKLNSYFRIPYGELSEEVFEFNFSDFCQTYDLNTMVTFNGLQLLNNVGIISLTKEFRNHPEMQVIVPSNALLQYLDKREERAVVVKSILRTYGGVFDIPTRINPGLISKKTSQPESKIFSILEELHNQELIELKHIKTDAQIKFLEPREDDKTINRIADIIKNQLKTKTRQVKAVVRYIKNTDMCRQKMLLKYFGEKDTEACGKCDYCRKGDQPSTSSLTLRRVEILKKIIQDRPCTSRELVEQSDLDETIVISLLKTMLEKEVIQITDQNTYCLK